MLKLIQLLKEEPELDPNTYKSVVPFLVMAFPFHEKQAFFQLVQDNFQCPTPPILVWLTLLHSSTQMNLSILQDILESSFLPIVFLRVPAHIYLSFLWNLQKSVRISQSQNNWHNGSNDSSSLLPFPLPCMSGTQVKILKLYNFHASKNSFNVQSAFSSETECSQIIYIYIYSFQ